MGEVRLQRVFDAARNPEEIEDEDEVDRSRAALERETAALRARVAELEQVRVRLEDFAALVAHELVKPLVLARSRVSDVLEETGTELDEDAHLDLTLVVDACSRARTLVDALLADAQQQGSAMQREPVDVGRLVRDCVAMLEPEIERARARVELGELPMVHGNAVLLGVVFRNLIGNAIEHGYGSGREIRVSADRSERAWTFAVDSPGPPLSEEERRRMFGAVWRDGGRRRTGGAGLGLVLVRRIVERHGGRVGVTSPDGSANRFFFTLPDDGGVQRRASRRR
jgi:light-regulated signal transduction histidine kinase (bacteriophytochrome)